MHILSSPAACRQLAQGRACRRGTASSSSGCPGQQPKHDHGELGDSLDLERFAVLLVVGAVVISLLGVRAAVEAAVFGDALRERGRRRRDDTALYEHTRTFL